MMSDRADRVWHPLNWKDNRVRVLHVSFIRPLCLLYKDTGMICYNGT
jgi:hypothetical protein